MTTPGQSSDPPWGTPSCCPDWRLAIVWILGLLVLLAGLARICWAFQAGGSGKRLGLLVLGILMLLCGGALVANPLFASGALTVVLAVYFVVDGIMEIAAAIKAKPLPDGALAIFGGPSPSEGRDDLDAIIPVGELAIGILLGIKLFLPAW